MDSAYLAKEHGIGKRESIKAESYRHAEEASGEVPVDDRDESHGNMHLGKAWDERGYKKIRFVTASTISQDITGKG